MERGKPMRITKEPEERKREILDTAMRLFCENGYEKTSISDIAKAVGVAQGLCYRYFPSKEALFDCAIEQYADELTSRFLLQPNRGRTSLKETIETMSFFTETKEGDAYTALHAAEADMLERAKRNGEIDIEDTAAAASFCVYGQIGILLNREITLDEKEKQIRDFLIHALRL